MVVFLLNKGARANIRNDDGITPHVTPLMFASSACHLGVVQALLQHGLELRDNIYGCTALHGAARSGHKEVVRSLLIAGADPTTRDDQGRTPRTLAQMRGEKERDVQWVWRCSR